MTVTPITRRPLLRAELERAVGYGRSTINAWVAEGMPTAGKDRRGRNLFDLAQVTAWMRLRKIGGGLATTRERGTA